MSTSENSQNKTNGGIEVICGSMFSGKTKELIFRLINAQQTDKRVICFKPEIDTRYDKYNIVSHDNKKFESLSIKKSNDILNLSKNYDVIGIDEFQFFDEDAVKVCSHVANTGKKIIIAGLDMDFLGRPFNFMPSMMALSEKITKLHAICNDCSYTANHTFRKNKQKELVQIGEKSDYLALCRTCFNKRTQING